MFESVVRWVNSDPEHRQESLAQLMEHVRLPLLSREYLVSRVETEAMIKNNVACKDFLIEALKYHLLTSEQRSTLQTPRTRPRTPIGLPKVMFVVGGQAPKAIRRYVYLYFMLSFLLLLSSHSLFFHSFVSHFH